MRRLVINTLIMKILADVRVWQDGGRSEDTTIEITKDDLEELATRKALELIDGLSASVVDIQVKTSF